MPPLFRPCAAALGALLLTAAAAAAQDRLTLALDWFVNPDHAPIVLAQELGYFTEVALAVTAEPPSDPSAPPRMAAAGRADIAVSYQPQLHLNRHAGLPLVRVGTLIGQPLTCLVVLAEGPVRTLADLKGRRVGFAVAGVQEALLDAMLAHAGLAPDDVERINIGWSISPALMAGQVDAVIGAFRNFELHQLALEGRAGRCFNPEDAGAPAYDELIFVANPDLMDAGVVARFLGAVGRAATWLAANPEEGWRVFAASAPELDTELNRLAWADTWPLFAADPAALDAARYAAFEAFLAARGLTPGGMAVADMAVVPAAAAR